MNDLININRINTVNYLKGYTAGKFRFIVKCRAGFMSIVDGRENENKTFKNNPEQCIAWFKKGALQSVEFCPESSDIWLTVFAKKGKKIVMIDESILRDLTVGTINSYWTNTELYCQRQYKAVNTKTWASKAYVMNETEEVPA